MSQSPDKSELQEMLQAASSGDAEAWRLLVDAYYGRVYGLVRAQCQNPDLAEEITQSTFCTIVVKLREYTEIGRFEPWLFRIAMNRLRDELRRRRRQAMTMEDDALTGMVGAGGADPDDEPGAVSDEAREQLRRAMDQLSEADRKIVHLRHCAGLSFKQIADVQDQPMGTVLARHHRALKKLRDLLPNAVDPVERENS